ncbi:MAG TPA: HAMP domain-containing sensor histidine kinase [Rhodocyclaceae bacterium]|nr:HAMP domain-containing sensor histidine kinase [Rhodocyclaceae bacterium]
MIRRHSLRRRVAFAFAAWGAALSLVLTFGIWFAAHDVSRRLIGETLTAEVEDYMARRARNPNSLPPDTATLRGYVVKAGEPTGHVPEALRDLSPGQHELDLDGRPYRVEVAERAGERVVMLFNLERQRVRERRFFGYLILGAVTTTLLATLGGLWLAGRVIAPVTQLARSVSDASLDIPPRLAVAGEPEDEITELAGAFDRYVARLAAFVERERAFAADASHELRTPLAVMRGAAEVLAEDPALTPAQRQRVARIERACVSMTDLIATLLLLAREEDSSADTSSDVAQVARDCVARYQPMAVARGTTLSLTTPDAQHLPVPAAMFAIIVANLVQNAIAHTENGAVAVHLDEHRLTVRDTGTGIRDADLHEVFQRYRRGPESSGAGIGLALVKRVCDRQGWTIALDSREGGGTTATLRF